MNDNRFSLAEVFKLRSKAFSEISDHAFAAAIADVDTALQTSIAERNVDDQQALVTAARHLSQLMDEEQA